MNDEAELPIDVDVKSVKTMLDNGDDFMLLDCRERDEYEHVHIDAATLLPMSEIQTRVAELDRDKHIVVHCHFGGRSLQVTEWLRSQGFDRVQNMTGGIDAWSVEVDPSKPRYR